MRSDLVFEAMAHVSGCFLLTKEPQRYPMPSGNAFSGRVSSQSASRSPMRCRNHGAIRTKILVSLAIIIQPSHSVATLRYTVGACS